MMVNQWLALSLLTGLLLGCGGGSNDEQTTVNKSPVAQEDHFNTLESTPITLSVLANDVEPESEAMTIQTATVAVAQGVVTVSSDKKTLLFTPKASFIGDADITYTIADTQSNKASAHVFVSVKALQSLSARQDTTCAVTPSGTVKCWGGSDFGQLGDNDEVMAALTDSSKKFKSAPVTVVNLNGIKQVAVGYNHACAISQTGSVSCWGDNSRGQIGDGTTTLRPQAIPVVGLSAKVTQLALTYQSSCALLETGAVQCWGGNTQGELGVGVLAKINQSTSPKNVVLNGITIKRLVSGRQHLCGITNSDTLVCWGWNDSGQLGLADTTARFIPTAVTSVGSGIQQVAAGYGHTCAVSPSNTICWGDNSKGQLGNGTTTFFSLPVVVSDLSGVTELALGKEHSCATKSSNDTMCWGSRQAGQTAQSINAVLLDKTPVLLTALTGKQSISAGDFHTCSISVGGAAKCWGKNDLGQLGDDSTATIKESAVVVSVKNLP